jgi:hypothetical protein
MRFPLITIALFIFCSCNDNRIMNKTLQSEINYLNAKNDSLEKEIQNVKPELGELMLGIQVHHNKLWFAGHEGNWPLAQFEHDEIMEVVKQAEEIEKERPEVRLFRAMIYPQLDTIQLSITQKNEEHFSAAFTLLTSACNNCHEATKYNFNRIIIPEHPPFSNQEFSPKN